MAFCIALGRLDIGGLGTEESAESITYSVAMMKKRSHLKAPMLPYEHHTITPAQSPFLPSPNLRLPPPPRCLPREIRSTSLQLVQNLFRIRSVHIKRILRRCIPPPDLLDDIVRVRGANHGDLGGEPLLERLGNEVAVGGEPAGHGRADGDCLRERGTRGGKDDVASVDWDVFLGGGGYADLVAYH
jgi:hypothetical protein